jgi:hypothetical protein
MLWKTEGKRKFVDWIEHGRFILWKKIIKGPDSNPLLF